MFSRFLIKHLLLWPKVCHMPSRLFHISSPIRKQITSQKSKFRDQSFAYFQTNLDYSSSIVQFQDDDHVSLYPFKPIFPNTGDLIPDIVLNYLKVEKNTKRLNRLHLKSVMEALARTNFNPSKYVSLLKLLDDKISFNINDWSLDFMLFIFDAWFWILGKKINSSKYFTSSLEVWNKNANKFTKNNIIQVIYYFGVLKPVKQDYLLEIMKQKLENSFIHELTDTEWALVCLSYFRTGTKLDSNVILSKIIEVTHRLIENNDCYNLINTLKCIRHAQCYDEKMYQDLRNYVTNKFHSFNFVESTHFLAAFSSQKVYIRELFCLLEKQGMTMLLNEEQCLFPKDKLNLKMHPSVQSRAKDIARFLWALVHVGHKPEPDTIANILATVEKKYDWREYNSQVHHLVDTLHSLAIINVYPSDLLKKIFTPSFLSLIWKTKRAKPRYQLYFIYKSMEIDCPNMYLSLPQTLPFLQKMKPIQKDLQQQMLGRNGMAKAYDLFQQHFGNEYRIMCQCILPHIVFLGITLENPKNNMKAIHSEDKENVCDFRRVVCIEVLDADVYCRNSTQLIGLMKAKLRQLEKSSYKVISLTVDDIESLYNTPEQQKENLTSLLKHRLFCMEQ